MSGAGERAGNPAGLVNQRLYYCRLLLDRAQQVENAAEVTALGESALLQLRLAYVCYLQELAQQWRVGHWPAGAAELRAALRRAGRDAAEVEHLETLERTGWLGELLAAASALERPHAAAAPGLIAVAGAAAAGGGDCRQWLQALDGLIAQQRELLQEW